MIINLAVKIPTFKLNIIDKLFAKGIVGQNQKKVQFKENYATFASMAKINVFFLKFF